MPLYKYTCPHCGKVVEKLLKQDDQYYNYFCSDCGVILKLTPSQNTFILKGGCWEKDGYCKKK